MEPLKRIVYLEDDESIAEVAKLAMESLGGFEVTHFFSGPDALAALDTLDPQIFIIDIMMPKMDGLTVLQNIRSSGRFNDTPILFMTAKVQAAEIDNYLKNGAYGVIHKPFDPMKLCDIINDFWRSYSAGPR